MSTGTVWVPVPGIFHFSGGIGTGIGQIWYRKSPTTGIGKIWCQKKVLELVSEIFLVPEKVPVLVSKIFGTGKGISIVYHFGYRQTLPLTLC